MTIREEELLELIRKDPSISQQELAGMLGITRSSVAVHITNLIRKGDILGKGYILKKKDYISVLGGANIDIIGFPTHSLVIADSNPGRIRMTLGGVGRNIAENLVHLGAPVKLITAIGEDIYGKKMLEHANTIGLDMKESLILSGMPTSTYLAILDEDSEMKVAINQMDIIDEISIDFIQHKRQVIEGSKVCVLDTNIRTEVLHYVLDQFRNTIFFLDTVSSRKALKIKDRIGAFHTIKPNRIEAELLSGIRIEKLADMRKASEFFIEKGVKRVFITLGSEGVFYNDGSTFRLIPNPRVDVVNATGAGDAFIAALTFCHFSGYGIDESARFAMAAAILALSCEETINPNLSKKNVEQKMMEVGLC